MNTALKRLIPLLLLAFSMGRAEAQTTWFESLDVTVVNVDVVVQDRDGNPIRGLRREDFRVLEDGSPVDLTNFSAVEGGELHLPSAEAPAADGEQGQPQTEAAPSLDLLILIDDTSLQPQGRNRLIEEVVTALDRLLRPGDWVMVAVNDGSVKLVAPLTTDREAVAAALRAQGKSVGRAVGAQLDLRALIRDLEAAGSQEGGGGAFTQSNIEGEGRMLLSGIRNYALSRYQDATRSTGAIREWVDSLAALPGRKAVLMLSDGFSRNPAEAVLEAWLKKFQDVIPSASADAATLSEYDTNRLLLELADFANANRVTLYTIGGESAGLSATGPEQRGLDAFGQRVWTPSLESLELSNLRASLATLAEHTGGTSGVGTNALRGVLDRLRDDFDDYYSLAYTPPEAKSGKNRRIEVELVDPKPGYELRFRRGYRDKTAEERLDSEALSVVLLGQGENTLGVEVGVGRSVPATEKGLVDVPITVKIPLANVVLVPGETHHEGRLLIALTTRDEVGRTAPVQRIAVPIRVPNEQILSVLEQSGGWSTTLRVRQGPHRVGVAVRDLYGATDSVAVAELGTAGVDPEVG